MDNEDVQVGHDLKQLKWSKHRSQCDLENPMWKNQFSLILLKMGKNLPDFYRWMINSCLQAKLDRTYWPNNHSQRPTATWKMKEKKLQRISHYQRWKDWRDDSIVSHSQN